MTEPLPPPRELSQQERTSRVAREALLASDIMLARAVEGLFPTLAGYRAALREVVRGERDELPPRPAVVSGADLLARIAALEGGEQAAQGSEPAESAIPAALLAYVEDDMTVDEARAHLMQRWITLNAKRLDAQRPVEQRQFEFDDPERAELAALDAAFAWFQPQ